MTFEWPIIVTFKYMYTFFAHWLTWCHVSYHNSAIISYVNQHNVMKGKYTTILRLYR